MGRLFLYSVPGKLGGAATRTRDLLRILRSAFEITVVLPHVSALKDREVGSFLEKLELRFCLRKDVPARVDGVALGICEKALSRHSQSPRGMSLSWFKQIGLTVPEAFYLTLQRAC